MDFSNVVGFLVTMAAILYMFIKRIQNARKDSETHQDDSREKDHQVDSLKDFLKSLESDMQESKDFKTPPPKPKVSKPKPKVVYRAEPKPKAVYKKDPQEEFKFRSDLDDLKTKIDERKLKIDIKNKYEENYGEHLLSPEFRGEKRPHLIGYRRASRIKKLIQSLPSKKEIVLLHEIMDKPKGFKL